MKWREVALDPMFNLECYLDSQEKRIEQLNNIKDLAIKFININQDEKTLSLSYYDCKKLRGILNNDEFYIKIFKEQLKELKESDDK